MTNILTTTEASNVLRCAVDDAEMLALLPLVDAYIKNASGRDWSLDTSIRPEAKAAARILLVRWHEDPASLGSGGSLSFGLTHCLLQLEALALQLETAGIPDEALAIVASMPTDGGDDIAITANLVVIFNHAMAAGATSCAVLTTAAGASVTTTNGLDATSKILTINPDASLSAATSYILTLTAAPDSYGQTISETIEFTTA